MPNDDSGTGTPLPPELTAEGVMDLRPPVQADPPRATLTIDLGSLTPDTVAAIQAFVAALAKDPAKGASSGPMPGVPWPSSVRPNTDAK